MRNGASGRTCARTPSASSDATAGALAARLGTRLAAEDAYSTSTRTVSKFGSAAPCSRAPASLSSRR
jgi:hypothetical protein